MTFNTSYNLHKPICITLIAGLMGILVPYIVPFSKPTTLHLYAWLTWSVTIFGLSMNILLKLARLNEEIQLKSTRHQINEITEHIDKLQRVLTQHCNEIKTVIKDHPPQSVEWTPAKKKELLDKLIAQNQLDPISQHLIIKFLTDKSE
ncbi:MAG: hypothetical protein KBF37_10250 [Saprospiraceae bacterium]|jgi:Asp-tRNA(Asn)/Glu-tRNA(Gln) amidotransferase C subunit|nr:hypothetical protein [Saprospiraceae bacterium]